MKMISIHERLLILLAVIRVYPSATQDQSSNTLWSYANTQNWGNNFPSCNGKRQSPIQLKVRKSFILPLTPLVFQNYEVPLPGNVTIKNNGHSVQFEVSATINGRLPTLAGGSLRGRYEAVGVHFHWGSSNSKGSEHVIDGVRYDVEMHIVHKNVLYSSVAEASRHSDGLAVLGVILKIAEYPDLIYPGLYKVFDQLPNVVISQSSANISGRITLGQMLGDLNTRRFFTYSGSLTTPDCSEAVTWIVFPQVLPIVRQQIEKFWLILDDKDRVLINNFRPLQNRNGRPVFLVQ